MAEVKPCILIIDDDTQLRTMLVELLTLENYQVESAGLGRSGLEILQSSSIDLVVLDVMMAGMDGFEVLKQIRQSSQTPVLMLTARGEDEDRITGLEQGADDYLAKPFNPRELLLRIRAILRRIHAREPEQYVVGNIKVEPANQTASLGDLPLSLTAAELRLLSELMSAPGSLISRETLSEQVLGRELSPYDRALDTHVSNLRSKLGKNKQGKSPIRSVRGEGYMIVAG